MTVIGLTGSYGSGKTFVASVFKSLGARVCDADRIAHSVISRPGKAYNRIVREFGPAILGPNGRIDRKKLGKIVFSDKRSLAKLNGIVHPPVIKEILIFLKRSGRSEAVVIDAPLLIEAKLGGLADKIVVVKCSKRRMIERCEKKRCLKKEEILSRIRRQMPLKKKVKMADFVIDNSRTMSETKRQAIKVWREILWR